MSSWQAEYEDHCRTDPNHVIEYINPETGLVYYKCGCIECST